MPRRSNRGSLFGDAEEGKPSMISRLGQRLDRRPKTKEMTSLVGSSFEIENGVEDDSDSLAFKTERTGTRRCMCWCWLCCLFISFAFAGVIMLLRSAGIEIRLQDAIKSNRSPSVPGGPLVSVPRPGITPVMPVAAPVVPPSALVAAPSAPVVPPSALVVAPAAVVVPATAAPTQAPIPVATEAPTQAPTLAPTVAATVAATEVPSEVPTQLPTDFPTPSVEFGGDIPLEPPVPGTVPANPYVPTPSVPATPGFAPPVDGGTDTTKAHTVYGSAMYRRVCATVYHSELCLTLRFPFNTAEQDPTVDYPKPVDKLFYNYVQNSDEDMVIVDKNKLSQCMTQLGTADVDTLVKYCLDSVVNKAEEDRRPVVAGMFTRKKEEKWYTYTLGGSDAQKQRLQEFFQDTLILVVGEKQEVEITRSLIDLLDDCEPEMLVPVSASCNLHDWGSGDRQRERELSRWQSFSASENEYFEGKDTFIGVMSYAPATTNRGPFVAPEVGLGAKLEGMGLTRQPGWTTPRDLVVIAPFPMGFSKDEASLDVDAEAVISQHVRLVLTGTGGGQTNAKIAEMGYNLKHIIAFDGMPEFYPTHSGALRPELMEYHNAQEIRDAQGGYEGWIEDYGTNCRGPLPNNSRLTALNEVVRSSFAANGHDMNFYGRTWEFVNQLWWQTKMWDTEDPNNILDCQSSNGKLFYSIHKYFLQVMLDDHLAHLDGEN